MQPLRAGLNLFARLHPVPFGWKGRVEPDLNLIAEEVGQVEPLLVTRNKDSVIEGVKYDQLTVVLINTVKEQQALIKQQQQEYEALAQRLEWETQVLKEQLSALERLVRGLQAQSAKITSDRPQ
ncbi:MAG TPA: hypothetical protein PLD20_34560 [Blastocatellia bacterium]|nr:hypothetical protein [Blastocatellia bacterium]HMY75839.1 hypothetical protein [Blastocatellia bacterium]HMZ23098.1 hypothetical protein [Blastocatellia bacterium]HNG34875.1 hypothetical protein [Blastocatellia bacterium]